LSAWVIIDDQGRACSGSIQRTIRELKGSLTQDECIDFLIVNCGFAAIQIRDQIVHVRFRPETLAGGALAELLYRIYDTPWRRAAASTFVGGVWRHHVLPSDRDKVIEWFSAMDMQRKARSAVLRHSRPAHNIPERSPMGRVLRQWRAHPDSSAHDLRDVLVHDCEGRYVWVDVNENGALIMSELGQGFPEPVEASLKPGIGYQLQDQPDVVFGAYCAEVYGAAGRLGWPTLEDVDAIMTTPFGGRFRRRYSRLILPFRSSAQRTRLLGVSFEDPGIDLRARAI
jgi:hypothetical protein